MATIQLAATCTFLLAFLPCQAKHCLSNTTCCSREEADHLGKFLVARITSSRFSQTPRLSQSPKECWALSKVSKAEDGLRSTSPWRYWLDEEPNRYPKYLRQAYCSCNHCISLKSKDRGSPTNYTGLELKGNSVPIQFDTLVFYRRSCSAHRYYLEPRTISGLSFLVFLLLTASISAYMGAALLEVLVTLAFLGLRATHYYERLTRVNWPCLDFLRCISAAIVFIVVAFAVIAASHEGSAVSAFVFSLILIAIFCFDAYKTYRAEMGSEQDPDLG